MLGSVELGVHQLAPKIYPTRPVLAKRGQRKITKQLIRIAMIIVQRRIRDVHLLIWNPSYMAVKLSWLERAHIEAKLGPSKVIKLQNHLAKITVQKGARNVPWLNSDQKFFMDANKIPRP